jgi:NADH-quinone oxidoreductase subunit H
VSGWVADVSIALILMFAIGSLGIYGFIVGGWASESKYSLLGSMRTCAQMVSYEVSLALSVLGVVIMGQSLSLVVIVEKQQETICFAGPQFIGLLVFVVAGVAETNRAPFDLVEAESELVAGFMVEYGSTPYVLFMLGEYVAVMTMCALGTILFLGGWLPPIPVIPFTWVPGVVWFLLKVLLVFFMFAMVKAFVPRYRYDQLMRLGWKVFLPISLAAVVIVAGVVQFAVLAPK